MVQGKMPLERGWRGRTHLAPISKPKMKFCSLDSGMVGEVWERDTSFPLPSVLLILQAHSVECVLFSSVWPTQAGEWASSSWHTFSHLPGSVFTLITHRPGCGALSVNPAQLLISRSLAGSRCAYVMLLGSLLCYYSNCKCHMQLSYGLCSEGCLYNYKH